MTPLWSLKRFLSAILPIGILLFFLSSAWTVWAGSTGWGWCSTCGKDMPPSHDFTHGAGGSSRGESSSSGGSSWSDDREARREWQEDLRQQREEKKRVMAEFDRVRNLALQCYRTGTNAFAREDYVTAVQQFKLARQYSPSDPNIPGWLALATGGCGTQAGLVAGAKIYGAPYAILGITVSRPAAECVERIARFAVEAARLAGREIEVRPEEALVREGFIGSGYGIPTPEGVEAIRLVARTEGVFLDPTYTGKGMAGLIAEIRSGRIGKDDTVVFLHTGGEPGLFAHPEIGGAPV